MTTSRLRHMTSFIVMDVLERAQELERQGIEVVHLEVGEPDFDAPACVKAAICQALEDGHTHYTHSLGVPPLREAICADYHRRYGVEVQPANVIVFSGTSPAMMAVSPGVRVRIPMAPLSGTPALAHNCASGCEIRWARVICFPGT